MTDDSIYKESCNSGYFDFQSGFLATTKYQKFSHQGASPILSTVRVSHDINLTTIQLDKLENWYRLSDRFKSSVQDRASTRSRLCLLSTILVSEPT